jgi:hypothetical protein
MQPSMLGDYFLSIFWKNRCIGVMPMVGRSKLRENRCIITPTTIAMMLG